jgi:hypothetical protein
MMQRAHGIQAASWLRLRPYDAHGWPGIPPVSLLEGPAEQVPTNVEWHRSCACGLPFQYRLGWLRITPLHLESLVELSNPQFLSSQTQGEIGVLRWLLLSQVSFARMIWGSSVVGEYLRIWTEDWLSKVNNGDENKSTGDRKG